MQHHQRRFDARGEFERLERVLDGGFALAVGLGRELVEVRRGMVHAHRQRTEIVQGGNLDFARAHGVEDAGHEADARAVTEFGVFKTQFANFAQHGATVRVAVGIPTGREGIHVAKQLNR